MYIIYRQSIMQYNGGSVVAMVGKDCVAIASDLRLGNQALTVATNFEKVWIHWRQRIHERRSSTDLYSVVCAVGVPCDRSDIPGPSRTGHGCDYTVRCIYWFKLGYTLVGVPSRIDHECRTCSGENVSASA